MITTRSPLCEELTAFWTEWKRQRFASARLTFASFRACLALSFRVCWVGRILKPLLRAPLIDARARLSDPRWHTTRVFLFDFLSTDASDRAFGTLPPAQGVTWQSAAGFGQYAGRSMCASADTDAISATVAATTAAAIPLLVIAAGGSG